MYKNKNNRRKNNKKAKGIKKLYIKTNNNNLEQSFQLTKRDENYIQCDSNNETINNEDESTLNESFEMQCMRTARNKWRNNSKNETIHIEEENYNQNKKSKLNKLYEVLEIMDDFKIYKYSNVQRTNPHELIYEYFYDQFCGEDYRKAKVILFIGKTGDGKTTAINAFFNIIKGIKLKDKYRFILVKEPKKEKGQAESQTDGLHLYYIKDYNNQPIIIIDSQGFGDTRGKEYDEKVKKAFEYSFENKIDHINTICFIAKSTDARLDSTTKYIFSCATSLFSQDINENLIILATHADKTAMRKGPLFIGCISSDENFKNILITKDKKWWYAVDSKLIFDNDIDEKLTIFSYNQLKDLYEEKVQKSKAKDISKSSEVIKSRNKIKNIISSIISKYKDIIYEKEKLPSIDYRINEYQNKINDIDYKISNKKSLIDNIYIPDKDYKLRMIENERDSKIRELDNQYEEKTVVRFKYVGGNHTYCRYCEKNCHEYCDCYGGFVNRCYIFPIFGNDCEKCGHHKSYHTLHSSYKYVTETEKNKIYNYDKIQNERDKYWRKYDEIYDEYNSKMEEKRRKESELNDLYIEKSNLNSKKNSYINDKNRENENIKVRTNNLKSIILELMNISQKIKNIALNQFHLDVENEYIETSIAYLMDSSDNKEQIQKLKENQKYNKIFQEITKMSLEELIQYDETFLNELKKLI